MFSRTKLFVASMAVGISLCVLPSVSYADTCYTVQQGDTLWRIAQNHEVKEDTIRVLNNLHSDLLYPGQKLVISKDGDKDKKLETVQSTPLPQVSENNERAEQILNYAQTFIGIPYRSGGSSPSGFDCSGYTSYVYKNFEINLPRTAAAQYNFGRAVSASQAAPGDLVAFRSNGYISHVGIYMGNGKFIHSSSSKGIMISRVHDSYWGPRLLGYSRVITS